MKKILLFLVLPLMTIFSLSNCDKDDDSENENPQKQVGPSNNNIEEPQDITFNENQTVDGVTISGKKASYSYVDLGLPRGTKWATYNVGATKPTEYGDYFAWGETKTKEVYSLETYDVTNFTKYRSYSILDRIVLEADDDAVTANWGSAWRMPTESEISELVGNCDWIWVENFNGSGVSGQFGTSKQNGATIFLPAAGYRSNTDLKYVGNDGNYWSSSLYISAYYAHGTMVVTDGYSSAYVIKVGENTTVTEAYRGNGLSIRAVLR